MKKHIYEESNRLSYTMHGDYYLPDLVVNEEESTYGKYGMLRKQGVTEQMKMQDQMKWVGLMNSIKACAEEIVLKERVYM